MTTVHENEEKWGEKKKQQQQENGEGKEVVDNVLVMLL